MITSSPSDTDSDAANYLTGGGYPLEGSAAPRRARPRSKMLIGKGGLHGNVLRLAPPMTLTAGEAEEGLGALDHAITLVDKERTQ